MNKTLTADSDDLLKRVYNGDQDFTESELNDLATEYEQFDLVEGHNRRWLKSMDTILKIDDKYFMICWQEGLTESQENEFYNQPQEVTLTQESKTITVNHWKAVNQPEI